MQLHDAYNNPQKLSKFIVEVLYGAGNKAAAMLPYITHMPRTEGCAQYRKQMLAAAACAKLVMTKYLELAPLASSAYGAAEHHRLAPSCTWCAKGMKHVMLVTGHKVWIPEGHASFLQCLAAAGSPWC